MRIALNVLVVSSLWTGLALAGIDLKTLNLEENCGRGNPEVAKVIYNREHRSVDIFCKGNTPAGLLSTRTKKGKKIERAERVIDKSVNGKLDTQFRGLYYNTEVIANAEQSEPEYKEYRVDGRVIGYRGIVFLKNKQGTKAMLGAYYRKEKGDIIRVAKVFANDRSPIVPRKLPSDLEAPLKAFSERVRKAEDQGAWQLIADTVTLEGKDVQFATSNILMDLGQTLGATGLYELKYTSLKNVIDPAQQFRSTPTEDGYGQYCENLLDNGKPLEDMKLESKEDWLLFAKKCQTLTNELINAVAESTEADKWFLYSEIDEEQRGYVLIPSKVDDETYLKIYFDISHNE